MVLTRASLEKGQPTPEQEPTSTVRTVQWPRAKAEEDDDLGEDRERRARPLWPGTGTLTWRPRDAKDGTPKVWICSGDDSGSHWAALWEPGQKDQAREAEARALEDGVSLKNRREVISTSEGWERRSVLAWGNGRHLCPGEGGDNGTPLTAYLVKPWDGPGSVLALDYGFLVSPVPVLKLRGQLQRNHLQVPVVMIPRVVAIHTDDVHIRRLGGEHGTCSETRRL